MNSIKKIRISVYIPQNSTTFFTTCEKITTYRQSGLFKFIVVCIHTTMHTYYYEWVNLNGPPCKRSVNVSMK